MCHSSGVAEHESTAKHWGLTLLSSQMCGSQREAKSKPPELWHEALMQVIWMQSAVLAVGMTDIGESLSKIELLSLHLRYLLPEVYAFCDSIGVARELVPLDQHVTCQRINPPGSW